ncbi:hypothetical protein [Mesorhizobium sp.]|uniref:RidA family protein n=1 Tax=Mesorhizobium sp. TaxID=1871066 RepID=UPI0025D2E665|nr:hypothetical protein [Mesorhizobium sp.]
MRIDHPYSLFVKSGGLIWSCGQCPLDGAGEVLHPGNLGLQAEAVIAFTGRFLNEIGCDRTVITRLTVYYVKTADGDAAMLRRLFRDHFGDDVLITPVAIPYFYYEGMLIEVDVFGSTQAKRHRAFVDEPTRLRLDVVDADGISWANLTAGQLPQAGELAGALQGLLQQAGLSRENLLAEQWFAGSEQASASIADVPGLRMLDPCGVLSIERDGADLLAEQTFSTSGVLHLSFADSRDGLPDGVEVRLSRSQRHFHVTACDNAGTRGVVEQTSLIMQAVEQTLARYGLGFHDVRKATTYYISGSSAEELHDNMAVRNAYYSKPGPASTGLPVKGFPDAKALISVKLMGCLG